MGGCRVKSWSQQKHDLILSPSTWTLSDGEMLTRTEEGDNFP